MLVFLIKVECETEFFIKSLLYAGHMLLDHIQGRGEVNLENCFMMEQNTANVSIIHIQIINIIYTQNQNYQKTPDFDKTNLTGWASFLNTKH